LIFLSLDLRRKRFDEGRLANARLTGYEHKLALTIPGFV
jgi:hypothetical protein